MDMDDPWGSPWTDEIQHPITATKEKHGEVRPKTPAKAPILGLETNTNSPWDDDDDGFGDWAAVPAEDEVVRGNGLSFDGAGDAWNTQEGGREVKIELTKLHSSWNDSTHIPHDGASTLAPSLLPKNAHAVRQSSPDPWFTEIPQNDQPFEGLAKVDTDDQSVDEDGGESLVEVPNGGAAGDVGFKEDLSSELAETTPDKNDTTGDLNKLNSDEHAVVREHAEKIEERSDDHEAGHESSRPSSSPSDQSYHEPVSDSPRTSLDEEPRRPQMARKVSTKIQELVEHFDGLAKKDEEAVLELNRSHTRSITASAETAQMPEQREEDGKAVEEEVREDDDDFGDFEDGQSDMEDTAEAEEIKRPITPISNQSKITSSPALKMVSPQSQASSSPQSRYVKKIYGRVKYQVDVQNMDRLTSPLREEQRVDDPVERVFIMDTIPYDSFASTEERKTWYRISRYGSMRKHNSGDDENYARVNWFKSQVRDKTLKTVARWMEEDRISGRVTLGGGSKGSSIFGWGDTSAPAMPLDSLFTGRHGKKTAPVETNAEAAHEVPREWPKGLVRDNSPSKSRSPPKSKRRSSSKSASISDTLGTSPHVPVANFGWNANPTTLLSPSSLAQEVPKVAPITVKAVSSPELNKRANAPQSASEISMLVPPTQPKLSLIGNGLTSPLTSKPIVLQNLTTSANDDDDWGEMVASPVMPITPVLPSSQGLQYKTSESLGGTLSLPVKAPSITLPTPKPSSTSAKNFDDILVPKPRNSSDSTLDAIPSVSFSPPSSSFLDPIIQATAPPATSTNHNLDPWISADFSFFDSPFPASKPTATAAADPAAKPMVAESVSFVKAPPALSSLQHGKTRQEIEQDEIVGGIVKSLPDLSYMFRR